MLAVLGTLAFTRIAPDVILMVLGLGGYRFTDYLHLGAPLSLIVGATAVGLISLVWGLWPRTAGCEPEVALCG